MDLNRKFIESQQAPPKRGPGGEMIQYGIKSDDLDRLGGPSGEMNQNGTESDHLDRLGGPGCETYQKLCQNLPFGLSGRPR